MKGIPFLLLIIASAFSTVSLISIRQSFTHTHVFVIVLTMLAFMLIYHYLFRSIRRNSTLFVPLLRRPTFVSFVIVLSLLLLLSLKSSLTHLLDNHWLIGLFIIIGSYVTIGILLASVLLVLYSQSITVRYQPIPKYYLFYYAIPCVLVWSVFLVAFFPGAMTPDSLSHWRQIHTLEFSNWHPVLYTWFMLALTSIWHSPAIVVIGQSTLLALIFGYGMYSLNCYGIYKKWTWALTLLFALSPINTGFVLMIWKDVLYSASLFLLTIILIHIVLSKGKWLQHKRHLSLLLITLLSVIFIRNNGLPIILLLLILLLLQYRSFTKHILITSGILFIIYFSLTGPIFRYLNVTPANPNEALAIPTQQIARVIYEEAAMTEEQLTYFDQILPIEQWKAYYNPYRTDPIKFAHDYNGEMIFSDNRAYLNYWFEVVLEHPSIAMEAFLAQTSLVWQINQPENGYTDIFTTTIYQPNDYDLVSHSISPWLQTQFSRWYNFSQTYMKEWIWRPAIYTFAIILFTFISVLKLGKQMIIVALPSLLNTATIFAGLPAQDFRYLYANTLVIFVLIGLALLKKVQHE
ncbi:hypothetical protein Pryu01_00858 [Paraliobacillus ryukyuensis]|uniref:Dolichyl-phosphate-mannose-protein mannosyltransferase n=1 Tax=Paraliobacillus ryukyuensis TaxID=200904 RepID=A0A366EGL3_9BACI|nr:DUF6020 family protein [Paraliobacillus ryukyuensis]RBP00569.1 hypothetical protein DES48_102333 [Paraliobacillus ryukyuensis]